MADDPKLQKALDELARFEEGAWRVQPEVAQRVRDALVGRIEALGGTVPASRHQPPRAPVVEPENRPTPMPPPAVVAPPPPMPPPSPVVSEYVDVDAFGSDSFDNEMEDSIIEVGDEDDPNRLVFNFDDAEIEAPEHDDLVIEAEAEFEMLPDPDEPSEYGIVDDRPMLVVHAGTDDEEVLSLDDDGEIRLGRGKACSIRLKDSRASRVHCRVFRSGADWCVEDLGSANGTLVNGEFLQPRSPRELAGGEELIVGSTVLRFEMGAAEFA